MIIQWYPFSVCLLTFQSSTLHFFTEGGRERKGLRWLCYYSLSSLCPLLVQLAWTWRYLDIMINWSSSDWVATLNTLSTILSSLSPKSISWILESQIKKETKGCFIKIKMSAHLFFILLSEKIATNIFIIQNGSSKKLMTLMPVKRPRIPPKTSFLLDLILKQ